MMPMRQAEVLDAVIWWVHVTALGDRVRIPEEAQRLALGSLALLSVAPVEVIGELRAVEGGLGALGDRYARRLAALGCDAQTIVGATGEAMQRISQKAEALFAKVEAKAAAPAGPADLPEPPDGDVEVTMAYHEALKARNAYLKLVRA